jgi:sulfoxide reductase heme-binding subunit YedZ
MMTTRLATRPSIPPRSWRYRLPRYHLPLALGGVLALVLFMTLPAFNTRFPMGDILSGPFPQQVGEGESGPMDHGPGQARPMDGGQAEAMDHGPGQAGRMDHGADQAGAAQPGEGGTEAMQPRQGRSLAERLTTPTGYVALGLLGFTLLIGPANLLLRRRNPVSSYLRRDAGTWTAIFSGVHTFVGLQVHGSGQLSGFLNYFVAPDGSPRLSSFGLGNWTGLAALVVVAGLLTLSSDAALRKLGARPWKRLQRLNYALFVLVIAHAFFYGALLRTTSPFTLLLGLSVLVVFVGQAVGVWLWRRRHARPAARAA